MSLKLIAWNVAGRTRLQPEQARAVARQEADLVCLQEVRASTAPRWREALADAGLPHALDSSEWSGGRRLFNLTASRWELTELPPLGAPQPERILGTVCDSQAGLIEVFNAHIPPARAGSLVKVETCEALYERLSRPCDRHRALAGDLNTPRGESTEGVIETFASNHPEWEARWDAAERSVLSGLAEWDLRDAFRELHGWERGDVSWVMHTRARRKSGHRLDHVLASASLRAVLCDYHHGWREAGLSDHSGLEAIFEPEP